jgi:4'-phosphopantetheinyl transferase
LGVSRAQPETEHAWAPGPLRPLLAEHAVHVWRADLGAVPDELGYLLDDDERARAARFANARDAERWRRSHGLLRTLLGRYVQLEPASLRFAAGEHGKPALAQDTGASSARAERKSAPPSDVPQLNFNMSHSRQLALYAFSHAGAVGVDVETARPRVDEVAIAARMLGDGEAQRLRALDPASRKREFLRAWTRHEATLKCVGVGIGGRAGAEYPPWIIELEMGHDAAGAVAAEQAARELRCWDWQGHPPAPSGPLSRPRPPARAPHPHASG